MVRSSLSHEELCHRKAGYVNQAFVRDTQFRDHDQSQQRMLHVGIVQDATAVCHCSGKRLGLVGHLARRAVRHQARDGQFDQGQFVSVAPEGDAASDLGQPVRGQRHLVTVGADDDHMMAVMRHGRGQCHPALVAKARHEGVDHASGRLVALDQRDLADA